jgi:16S rRNA (guanine966-N2)-methyltransferase
MRVNTGLAKGRKLKSLPGDLIRPITDRAKQAIFNILMDDVRDSRWLDLFAGTGAVGVEALSRGAAEVTFIDILPEAIRLIRENLRTTGLQARARVIRQDAFDYLAGRPNVRYDFIFIAPPQYQGLWSRAVIAIDEQIGWLAEAGTVIVQLDPREYAPLRLDHLELSDQRRYGKTMLLFYDRRS